MISGVRAKVIYSAINQADAENSFAKCLSLNVQRVSRALV